MALGAATVVNDLVFTTTFDGRLIAFDTKTGSIVWNQKLPALSNSPIAIVGDTVIAAAGFPGGPGQKAEVVAFRLGSHGDLIPAASPTPATSGSGSGGSAAGAPVDGAAQFTQNCASCHTLAAAKATGAVGPNLDQLKPSKAAVVAKVTNGGGGMPAFGGRLSPEQIDAIAAYVASSAGKK
jgi:outer membrane protein assembly factor BamB